MSIGEKIVSLRKKKQITQESLAEKIGVTRQTISKWELNETSPDLNQAKKLSEILEISLDELADNDIQNLLVTKVSNTEKLAGLVIKILKGIGIFLILYFVILLLGIFCYSFFRKEQRVKEVVEATLSCSKNNKDYLITIGSDGFFNCSNCELELQIELKNSIDFSDIEGSTKKIETYFTNKDGICE